MPFGTHAIGLNRVQVEILVKHLQAVLEKEELKTVYLYASDDPEVHTWFDGINGKGMFNGEQAGVPHGVDSPDSVFIGSVFTLALDYEITPEMLEEMGMFAIEVQE